MARSLIRNSATRVDGLDRQARTGGPAPDYSNSTANNFVQLSKEDG